MALAPGTRLGVYEVLARCGRGGMGEVWKARDTRLGREVAIKILPAHVAHDPDLKARFEREARTLSSLSHPHICTLYDVGHQDGTDFLVMEYLEGETLADRLQPGALPLDGALRAAVEIAGALDEAHGRGIVHRDLKPGNIMLTRSGAKLLDFGLAKLRPATPPATVAGSGARTVSSPLTGQGSLVGTFEYMAPEQLEGQEADSRTDIFAFGAVVYEMLAGRRAFEGRTQASLVAAILKDSPPPLRETRPGTPRALERILRKCLEKDPADRWQSAQDLESALALIELDGPSPSPDSPPGRAPAVRRQSWLWPALVAAVAVVVALIVWTVRPAPPLPASLTRFEVPLPDGVLINPGVFYASLSPDGTRIAFTTVGPQGGIWVRNLDTLESRLLPGTQGVIGLTWSPDSRFIAFGRENQLLKVDVTGGPPVVVCESPDPVGSGVWTLDGEIVFGGRGQGPLRRVSAAGGVPTEVTHLDPGEAAHSLPSLLPDGRQFLYLRAGPGSTGIYVGSLDVAGGEQSRELLLQASVSVDYVPPSGGFPGYVLFLRDTTLMAQPFDDRALRLVGAPAPIAEYVGSAGLHAHFSASAGGALTYWTGLGGLRATGQLTWLDRQGTVAGTTGNPAPIVEVAVSPDGSRAALTLVPDLAGGLGASAADLWLHDFSRNVSSRFTFDPARDFRPVWSPDGSRLVFLSQRDGRVGIYEAAADDAGSETAILEAETPVIPSDWSRDGRFLLYSQLSPETGMDLWVLPMDGDREPSLVLRTDFNEEEAAFSPNGGWIAYLSDASGQIEVYVRPLEAHDTGPRAAAGARPISRGAVIGSFTPHWTADGTEVMFLVGEPGGRAGMVAVDVSTDPTFRTSIPRPLFDVPTALFEGPTVAGDVTADGQRMLISNPVEGTLTPQQVFASTPITVVLNWRAALPK